jgi:hypothetical protein
MRKKRPIENEFTYVLNPSLGEHTYVKLKKGKFKDLIYGYGDVYFNEENQLNFTYEIMQNPNQVKESRKLTELMGDILVYVMKQQCENGTLVDDREHASIDSEGVDV